MSRSTHLAAALLALAAATPAAAQPTPRPADYPKTAPAVGTVPPLSTPAPERRALANGLEVLYVRDTELPMVSAILITRGGTADEPAAHAGLAAFTATMLDEGAAGKTALQIADEMDFLGASLFTGASWDAAQTTLTVLRKNLPRALQLMADVVTRPDFPEAEVARLREERLTNLRRAVDQPATIAGNAFGALAFPASHPYGRFATLEGTQRTDRAALAAFHRTFYQPRGATLLLVGDVDPAAVQPLVERAFGQWTGNGQVPPRAVPEAPLPAERTIYLIDKPGAPQSQVRIGHPSVPRNNPDYFPLVVMNTILGGQFGSRLNLNLRETHAFTYGAGSSLGMRRGGGLFNAQSGIVTAKTDSALVEFFREIDKLRAEPVPAEELERTKRYLASTLPVRLETANDVGFNLADLITNGVGTDFFSTYVDRVMAVTAADVQRVARQYLRPDRAVVVVVGDRAAIEAGIRAANLGKVEVREAAEFAR